MTPALSPRLAHLLGEVAGLGDGGHHRRHHPGLGAGRGGGRGDAVELALEQAGVVHRQPQPADAEGRVLLVLQRREGDRLVGAGVEGAHDDVPVLAVERVEHLAVDRGLLVDATARRGGRGSTARCGTARRPRPAPRRRPRADSPSATLASSLTRTPSVVSAGPVHDVQRRARAARSASTWACGVGRVDGGSTVPAVPSTSTGAPSAGRAPRPRRPRTGCRAGGR